ncbi:MAG: polysaccharide deacetylase family protein [Prolixibacteraceae bacterium]
MSNEPIKHILSSLSGFLPFKSLMPANRQHFIFPFWHAVSDHPPDHLSVLYQMPSSAVFKKDLDFFLKHYKAASIVQVEEFANRKIGSKLNLFFPSFDDGLSECYHTIAPILKSKGIPAAFFINPDFVDNKQLFHRHKASLILNHLKEKLPTISQLKAAEIIEGKPTADQDLRRFLNHTVYSDHAELDRIAMIFGIDFSEYLKQKKPYMSLSQIQELQNDGFIIGGHSLDHREFYQAPEREILHQISGSMDFVVQELKPEKKWFAFPYTDSKIPDSVFGHAIQEKIWDQSFGTAGMKDETMPNHIQRIPMESGELMSAEKMIRTEYAWYALKSIFGKNKVNRR